jgi:hypothetical protein
MRSALCRLGAFLFRLLSSLVCLCRPSASFAMFSPRISRHGSVRLPSFSSRGSLISPSMRSNFGASCALVHPRGASCACVLTSPLSRAKLESAYRLLADGAAELLLGWTPLYSCLFRRCWLLLRPCFRGCEVFAFRVVVLLQSRLKREADLICTAAMAWRGTQRTAERVASSLGCCSDPPNRN